MNTEQRIIDALDVFPVLSSKLLRWEINRDDYSEAVEELISRKRVGQVFVQLHARGKKTELLFLAENEKYLTTFHSEIGSPAV